VHDGPAIYRQIDEGQSAMKDQARGVRSAPDVSLDQDTADLCELLTAELQSRRERLAELLRLIAIEAERHPPAQHQSQTRSKCKRRAVACAGPVA
jgi:hypothetical protein